MACWRWRARPSRSWNASNSGLHTSIRTGGWRITASRPRSRKCGAQGSRRMDEQRTNNEMDRACRGESALLRKEIQWISDTTTDPEIKLKVHYVLRRSLEMPPQDPD